MRFVFLFVFFYSSTAWLLGNDPIRSELKLSAEATMSLEEGWQQPPQLSQTRVWWWWLNGNTDKETITRDLEVMKSVGIGGANIIDAGGDNQHGNHRLPHGPDFATEAWRELFHHAVAEADRLNLELGFNIQSGWNLGGPTVTPAENSKRATFTIVEAVGGKALELKLEQPETRQDYYQDVAVLAWPKSDEPAELPQFQRKCYTQYPGGFTAAPAWHLLGTDDGEALQPVCQPEEVLNISDNMDSDGMLRWEAPHGDWEIMRFGYSASGAHVSTHSENGGGLAIDYLDAATFDAYWEDVIDPILDDVEPYLGKSLRFLHTDSWELGPVNWTRRMPEEFEAHHGYGMTAMLPTFAGRIIGSQEESNRFLNDVRRTIGDLMAENKYTRFSERAHERGLGIHPESGGPHAGPMDALRNLGISDMPMGEFWSTSPMHRVQDFKRFFVKQTSSAANIYGRRIALAEAFTNIGRFWQHDPRSLKPTFDRAACEGHNLTMWHTFPSSKKEHGLPGAAYFAGEHFNQNITWWSQAHAFIGYLNRCHFMLQQGLPVRDVLHYYGDNIPSFVRLKRDDPAKCLPGYDYDVINLDAMLTRLSVDSDGKLVLPEGITYRVLSIPPYDTISLQALEKIAALVEGGGTLVGRRPEMRYGLKGGIEADREFKALCNQLWDSGEKGEKAFGKGRVFWGQTTREVLQADGVPQDFSWSGGDKETLLDFYHRRTTDTSLFFVVNRNQRPEAVTLQFRVSGLQPEFWDAVHATHRDASDFSMSGGVTSVPYRMEPGESLFVVFRRPASKASGAANVASFRPEQTINGPWKVAFDPKWGGPAEIEFPELIDWTTHADDNIRHYSGSATYEKTISMLKTDKPVWLDLGEVESLCEVSLNGKSLGILWNYPFRVEITDALQAGDNQLQVKVVNLWPNRIIGDASLPESERFTRTNIVKLTAETPLEPSGLIGPVSILLEE